VSYQVTEDCETHSEPGSNSGICIDEGIKPGPFDQSAWRLEADQELMTWATQQPEDWQIGGKCQAYLWGSGRHGQLAEGGG
jgi:hypothetical protein